MTERSGEAAEFDPRFDPAFQPGYHPPAAEPSRVEARSGAAEGPAHAASHLRSDTPADTGVDARPRAAGGVGVGSGAVGRTSEGAGAGAGGTDGADDAVGAAPESPAEPPRRNPFVLALWALSALITLAGIGMVRWSFTLTEELQTNTTGGSQADFQLSYLLQQSGPIFIVLGLAMAASTLFLHALNWSRRGAH